jgi:hypothetical protein
MGVDPETHAGDDASVLAAAGQCAKNGLSCEPLNVFFDCSAAVPMQRQTHCTEHQQQAQARKKSCHFGVATLKGELG